MPRVCSICHHPNRPAVEAALHGGIPLRTIAARWFVSKTALLRHRDTHISMALGAAHSPAMPSTWVGATPTRVLPDTSAPPVHDGEACARALLAGCTVEVEEEVLRHADRIRCPVEVLLGAIITVWARCAMPPP